jgi:transposase
LSRLLSGYGREVIVADARNVRLIGESRKKDDRLDVRALAQLARIDPRLLSPIQHRSAQAQHRSFRTFIAMLALMEQ